MKCKNKVNDLRPSENTSNHMEVRHDAAVELFKFNHDSDEQSRKEDVTLKKNNWHNGSEKIKSSGKFCDGVSYSENRVIGDGMSCSENKRRKHESKQKKKVKKEKHKEIIDINFSNNPSAGRNENLKGDIIYGDRMGSEKDQKEQRNKQNFKIRENSLICTDNYILDEAEKHSKKRKMKEIIDINFSNNSSAGRNENLKGDIIYGDRMGSEKDQKEQKNKQNFKSREDSLICTDNYILDEAEKKSKNRKKKDYFIESEKCGNSIKENVKEASVKSKKHKKSENKDNAATCPRLTLEASREERGQNNAAVTCNFVENIKSNEMALNSEKDNNISGSYKHEFKDTKKSKKKVSFSNEIEEFPLTQPSNNESDSDDLVWGRYSPEEDELIKKTIMEFIEVNQLGEQGLHMVLNCRKYWKQTRGCWEAVANALPWRGKYNIYVRAHSLFEKSSNCKWEPEESELLKRCYSQHGPTWKEFSNIFGKSRHQVKERYRRIKPENLKRGNWGQDEYQTLFNLVNLDLQLKANQEKKKTHAALKDNISWESISDKLSTRGPQACCLKWYFQLASSMVNEGQWTDLDDYKLIDAIQKLDPYCFEDIDWDNLLENRSGEICRKRWYEMIRHLDRFWVMSFVEQVDILSQRYCPDMIPYREKILNNDPAS